MALLFLCALAVRAPAIAQTRTGIFPARVEKLVRSGATTTGALTFSNEGAMPVTVTVSVVDFEVTKVGKVQQRAAGTVPSSVAPWLRISPLEARVEPGQRFNFRYSATAPREFEHLRGMVHFSATPIADGPGARQIVVATTLGMPFYLENRAAAPGELEVVDVRWTRAGETGDSLLLALDVTNKGSRNIRPTGFVQVRSADGDFLRSFDFNQHTDVVLPVHERYWEQRFGPVPPGELTVRLRFETSSGSSYRGEARIPAVPSSPW